MLKYHDRKYLSRLKPGLSMPTIMAKTMKRLPDLGVKRGTACSTIRRHQQTGQVEQPWGGAHNRKVDAEMTAFAIQTVEEHPEYTLLQINRELQTTVPRKANILIQCLSRLLRNQLIVMKRLETAPVVRNRDDSKQAQSAYADWHLQTVNHRCSIIKSLGNITTRRVYRRRNKCTLAIV